MSVTQHLLADATYSSTGGPFRGPRLVVSLLLCGLWAWRGYVRAERVERETGQRPWGWSPTGWSIMCFTMTLLGRLLLEVAIGRMDKRPRPALIPPPPVHAPPLAPAQPAGPMGEQVPYYTASAARDVLPGR